MSAPPTQPPSDVIWALDGQTMGTTWSARVIAAPQTDRSELLAAIQSELDAVVAVFSPWDETSEISRFNTAAPGLHEVSPEFWAVLEAAMDIADDTNGAVDPTLGTLVDLWGFGPPGKRPDDTPVPSDAEIDAALALTGWQGLRMNRDARSALQPGGVKLDFSGIAKGHAVDRVSDRLTELGATSHLVEIGGELRGRGVKPDGQPWWVEIEQPQNSPAPRTVMAMVDVAMATSGDYRRTFVHEGRRYSHTLDGRTGRPINNGLASVTVVHSSAMKADAFATALTVMGPYDGPEFAAAYGLAAHFVERTPRGLIERMTPLFAAMLVDDEEPAPLQ
jgi:thiamine biosynthesis lipoprotein